MSSEPPAKLKVPLENFAYEIQQDLPRLFTEHPTGIYVSHLHEEYGESASRILKAIALLEERHRVTVHQAASGLYYILPFNVPKEVIPFAELTDLQRRTTTFIRDVCVRAKSDRLQTNYAQLARHIQCSSGGIQTCLNRLVTLQYLDIIQPSRQGKQSELIIGLGPKLTITNTSDLKKTS